MKHEFDIALQMLRNNKASGIDIIPPELIKHSEKKLQDELFKLVLEVYLQGKWSEKHCTMVTVPIPKKASANKCKDFRTMSLIQHASKIMLQIIKKRLEPYIETYLNKS